MTNPNNSKKQFSAPTLVEYGKFEELTQGTNFGRVTDAIIPAGTPIENITFS